MDRRRPGSPSDAAGRTTPTLSASCLLPRLSDGTPGAGARRGPPARLDGRQHEGRLEPDFRLREIVNPPTRQKPTNHRKEAAMQRTTSRRLWLKGSIACALAMLALGTGRASPPMLRSPLSTSCWSRTPRCSSTRKPSTTVCAKFSRRALRWTPHTVPTSRLMQRFVLTEDLDQIYAAVGKVFASANVTGLKLEAFKYYYVPGKDLGLCGHCRQADPGIAQAGTAGD